MFAWFKRLLNKLGGYRKQERDLLTPASPLEVDKTPPDVVELTTEQEQLARVSTETAPLALPIEDAKQPHALVEEESVEEVVIPPPPRRSLKNVLSEIETYASWSGPDGKRCLDKVLTECTVDHPGHENEVAVCIQRGEEAYHLIEPLYKIGTKHGKDSKLAKEKLAHIRKNRSDIVWRAQQQLDKGDQARNRYQQARDKQSQGKAMSQVKPRAVSATAFQVLAQIPRQQNVASVAEQDLHPQDIRGLKPSPKWTLLIDETGTRFDTDAQNMNVNNPKLGRVVGLLMPQRCGLNQLPRGWHAVDKDIEEIDRVIQAVLDAPVGVLGINVQQLPDASVERWAFAVLRLIDLVLRLLPVNGATELTVEIEQRDEFQRGMEWKALAYDALLRLAQTYPQRARQIKCRIKMIGKRDSSFNGYVDALAFIWSGSSPYSKECLKNTHFLGTCFLPGDAQAITRTWEWLDRGIMIEGADWAMLLREAATHQPGSLVGTILERLGQACQAQESHWERYLEYTLAHLDSKAIDLRALGKQVEWLERFQPAKKNLPPLARFVWLIAKLARSNHLGQIEQSWRDEMHTLGRQLLEEDAPLVCRAELNLAVNLTNRYEFAQAREILHPWGSMPAAVPGLRFFAQVQSSLGQHAAFMGDQANAVKHFDQALSLFARLSNPRLAKLEARQTQTYRAIALMDDDQADAETVAAAIEVVTGALPEAATKLAVSSYEGDKYAHHLLVRYLALHPHAKTGKMEYLQQREDWSCGMGHPWPLIQLYRAMLMREHDLEAAIELAMEGVNLAMESDQGPVVQLIGASIRAIAHQFGKTWAHEEAQNLFKRLEQQLPAAQPRIIRLTSFMKQPVMEQPDAIKQMLEEVVPFNFH